MFLPLSYTEFIDMMKRGVKNVFDSQNNEMVQSETISNNIETQKKFTNDQTQKDINGNYN